MHFGERVLSYSGTGGEVKAEEGANKRRKKEEKTQEKK